jgi:DNA invertase Pin-like site-specific DNA recombinase
MDKVMLSLTNFAAEMEREQASRRRADAMLEKARAGHCTGGRVFGYDNVEVRDEQGRRVRVDRRINEGEAAVVRRIFARSDAGRWPQGDRPRAHSTCDPGGI